MSLTQVRQLQDEVKNQIKAGAAGARARLVAQLVEGEIARRADLLASGLVKLTDFEKEGKKIKPDQKHFTFDDNGGKVTHLSWSQSQMQAKEKFDTKFNKLAGALDKALASPSPEAFKALEEALNQK